jgi:hypothetical protein
VADANAAQCFLNQRRNLLLHTCHLHSLCIDAPEGAVRGGGLLLEPRKRPTGLFPCLCLFLSSSLSCLSLCSFSRSRC